MIERRIHDRILRGRGEARLRCHALPLADPDDVTAIDIEQLKAMMDEFIAKGGTYVDTAFCLPQRRL